MQRKIIPDVARDRRPISLGPESTVRDAALLMEQHNIGAILVTEGKVLVGIFTERDLVCRVVAKTLDPAATALSAVMTKDPDTVGPDTKALDALRKMEDGGYRHLPVTKGGRVLAVVSRRDFFGAEEARLEDESALWQRIG